MTDYFDADETRAPEARETAQFDVLRAVLKKARASAPGLDRQIGGFDIDSLTDRAALARLPVLRKSDLGQLQRDEPPFGGFSAVPVGQLKRLLVSPGPILDPEGHGTDWWGTARALFAAGFRAGDVMLNTFSYHFTPGGHIMESGAHALGCAVIPAGPGSTDQQMAAIGAFHPTGYAGTPDFLKILIDKADEAGIVLPITKALVSGAAFPPSLQQAFAARGIGAFQAYATADLGVVAYETGAREGLVVNEGLIVEIVRPGTGDPVPEGDVGEVVVSRLAPDYPLLRLGTGDLSRFWPGVSPCGRTNRRLAGWLGRADQRTKVKGMFVDPAQVAEIGRRHAELGRLRLVVSRQNEQDLMVLRAEAPRADEGLAAMVTATLRAVTALGGTVELVAPGALPNDGKVIADERPVG